jgi:hypothetical protein
VDTVQDYDEVRANLDCDNHDLKKSLHFKYRLPEYDESLMRQMPYRLYEEVEGFV